MKNIARRASIVTAAAAVSIGLLGVSAPAQADSSWGYKATSVEKSKSAKSDKSGKKNIRVTMKDSSWGW